MRYETKIFINGELQRLEDATLEQIKQLQDFLEKLFYKGEQQQVYKCIKDLQGANYLEGFIGTAEDFRQQALKGCQDNEFLKQQLQTKHDEELIDFIAETYEIVIVKE